ncbi:MAG: phenylalanine--tRNA ligase beta subunit-related protein [Mariniblastus sp.]
MRLLSLDADVPVSGNETVKPKVRDLLRHGGYKPTGRGKPASEYLRQAVEKQSLASINLPVDVCNVVSLHSGLPISVVDLDRLKMPLRIEIAPMDSEYIFNPSGHTIKLDGLLCLFDDEGPCSNGVKDSQRTKTSDNTMRTISIVWGTNELAGHSENTVAWYRKLLAQAGAATSAVDLRS